MNPPVIAKRSSQVDVDMYIARARHLRGEYLAQAYRSGLTYLRKMFAHKRGSKPAAA
ncbi:MAG TPA: hypothetical protein VIN05_13975 [Roseovarius sp.]